MRWPWQRERSEPRPETFVPEAAPPAVQLPPVPPAGWAFLAPLQRTIGSMELTHGPERFAGSLAAWSNPSFTGTMSHLVTADAPPGVIDVDGGGTGSGEAHRSEAAEMTLLVAPARSGRGGGSTTVVQRTSSAADAPHNDFEVPSDEPVTLPQDNFQPPSGRTAVSAEPSGTAGSAAQVQRFAVDGPPSLAPSLSVKPQAELPPAPADGGESLQSATPEQDVAAGRPAWDVAPVPRPHSADSTSDSHATYVSLPVPPAWQRSTEEAGNEQAGTGHRAIEGTADGTSELEPLPPVSTPPAYPTRLGLGRPLSFSQHETSVPPTPRALPGQESAWPLQRTAGSGNTAQEAPTSWRLDHAGPAAGEALDSAADATAPPADSFTAPLEMQERPTADAMPHDPGAGMQQPEQLLLPVDESSAPLLPDAMLPAALSASGESGVEGQPLQGAHRQPPPDLPVVSRLASNESKETNDSDDGPAPREAAGSLLQPDDPPNDGPVGSASVPGSLVPARISSAAPYEASVVSRLLGNERAEGLPAKSRPPADAATAVQRGDYGEPDSAPVRAGSDLPGPVTPDGTPREMTGDAHAPKALNTGQPAPLGVTIQRAEAGADSAPHRSGAHVVPLEARTSRPVAPGFTSVVWQRLAAKAPTVQQPAGWVAPLASPALPVPGSTIDFNDAAGGSSLEGVAGVDDTGNPEKDSAAFFATAGTGHQPEADARSDTGYGGEPLSADAAEPTGSSAAVGSSVQRTLALNRPAQAPGAGSPAVGLPFSSKHLANGAPEAGAPETGGRTLQRMATFPVIAPLLPAPRPAPSELRGTLGHPAVDSRALDSVVLTLATPAPSPGPDPGTGELMNHTYDLDSVVQRVQGRDVPETQSPLADGPAMAPVEYFPPPAAVEANSVPPPADDAPQAAERSTAGAPGSLGAATPDQLEELAKRLAGPIIRRIKAEMLLDRERRGLRTDPN